MMKKTKRKRGRKSSLDIGIQLTWALKNFDNFELLDGCPLAGQAYVKHIAETQFHDSLFPIPQAEIRNPKSAFPLPSSLFNLHSSIFNLHSSLIRRLRRPMMSTRIIL